MLEVKDRAEKYWVKVLSSDGHFTTFKSTLTAFPENRFRIEKTIFDSIISTSIVSLHFDIPPYKQLPLELRYRLEVAVMELVKLGLLKMPEREEVEKIFKEKHLAKEVAGNQLLKGIYGFSQYDKSYYDPAIISKFLSSTLYTVFQKRGSWEKVKAELEALATSLGVAEWVLQYSYNKFKIMDTMIVEAPCWDYGWWDYSLWGEEKAGKPVIRLETFDGLVVELENFGVHDMLVGSFWDLDYWDVGWWTEPDLNPKLVFNFDERTGLPVIVETAMDYAWRVVRNYVFTAEVVANYQLPRDFTYPWASGRVGTYSLPTSMAMWVEKTVENIVKKLKPDIDMFKLRLYKTAVLEIFGVLGSPHKKGLEFYRLLSKEELKRFWLEKWSRMGLEREVLDKLYESLHARILSLSRERRRDRFRFLFKYRIRVS